jgi:hypothetical protein
MKLHEEYIARHGLKMPMINHCARGSLFFHPPDPTIYPYSFLKIFWLENSRGPGSYAITHISPVHNGFYEEGKILNIISSKNLYWDQYEDYFINLITNPIGRPISSVNSLFAAWEMFVYIFDSWFKNQSQSIKSVLFHTLDKDNSYDIRIQNYNLICSYMAIHSPTILKLWKEEILIWVSCYSDWLFDFFESVQKTN